MSEYVLIAIRTVFSFILLLTLARFLGKKQISQLTFFDYVVGIVIGDFAASVAIDNTIKIYNGLTGLALYSCLSIIVSYGAVKSFKFRELVESSPAILVKDGKVMEKSLLKHRLTFDDLMNGLRAKGAFNISEVELALIETDGQISVMKKPEYQSLTPKDIGLSVEEDHGPSLVIVDGSVLDSHLSYLGYTKKWLLEEIKKQGANTIEDVFLAQINSNGTVFVDLFDDKKNLQQDKQKPNLAVKLRKVQAELESLASLTKDNNAEKMYFKQSRELDNMIKKLNPFLSE